MATVSPGKGSRRRIAAVSGAGIGLLFIELLCLPMFVPKPISFNRVIHGDLISPPPATNATITAIAPPIQPSPIKWTVISMPIGPHADTSLKATTDGHLELSFEKLASFWTSVNGPMPGVAYVPKLLMAIPDSIKSLDNREIVLKGFMLPLKLENGRATEFLLMRNRNSCCFGLPLRINEWVDVRMKGGGVKSIMDVPLTVYGTLHVGEFIKNGQMSCIYQLDGEKIDESAYFR
jgi:hypothetical protein